MLRVVIDTNQFVSAVISRHGASAQIIDAWRRHAFLLICSQEILDEITAVFNYPCITKKYNLLPEDIQGVISLIEHEAIMVAHSPPVNVIKEDPDDNKFLACALAARADYIISGDNHLLKLGLYKNTVILKPNDFFKILGG